MNQKIEPKSDKLFRLQEGDQAAWNELYKKCYPSINKALSRRFDDQYIIEEGISYAFIKSWELGYVYQKEFDLKGFLMSVAKNKCHDLARNKVMKIRREDEVRHHWYPTLFDDTLIQSGSSKATEKKRVIINAIADLTSKQRLFLKLTIIENKSIRETSAIMKIRPQTARNMRSNIIRLLKSRIEKKHPAT